MLVGLSLRIAAGTGWPPRLDGAVLCGAWRRNAQWLHDRRVDHADQVAVDRRGTRRMPPTTSLWLYRMKWMVLPR